MGGDVKWPRMTALVPGIGEGRSIEDLDCLKDAGGVQVGDGLRLRVGVQRLELGRHRLFIERNQAGQKHFP